MRYDFEVYADYDVVWHGGELLPPRDSAPDHTWDTIEVLLPHDQEVYIVTHPKRRYRKVNHLYWAKRADLPIHPHDEPN